MTTRLSQLSLKDLSHLADRPLPDAPDGKYAYQVAPKETSPFQGPTPAEVATRSKLTILGKKIESQLAQGLPIAPNKIDDFLKSAIQTLMNPAAIDDRQGFFTNILAILCKIPQDNPLAKKANDLVITTLYNSLPHPPASYIGSDPGGVVTWTQPSSLPKDSVANGNASWGAPGAPSAGKAPHSAPSASAVRPPWAFRSADGSGNNTWMPALGQSGKPYARDVENKHPLPANKLPDAGLVFDVLLKARDFQPHPNGNSAMTFAFASLVTHSLFRTVPGNQTLNGTSSYLDLSPLYGTNQNEQDMVRNKEEGRGLLYNDAFAEDRLVLVPPAASALLVVFSRNHNFIAQKLLEINERGRWKNPPPPNDADRARQDEEIFQTARLVNCGHFMAMIFGDYVGGFLGLARDGSGWSMNPFDMIKTKDGEFLGRGEGNHVSVEFNLLYRWHATTAQKDIEWTKELFAKIFPDKKAEDLQLSDFGRALATKWDELVDPNPRTRVFGGMKRGPDGSFDDDELAQILQDATATVGGAYRARGTPSVLRAVEIMGIMQGRAWGVCSMNEFRQFLGLKKFDSFEEWSTAPGVADAARQLYGHIDNLELYVGLQAEDCMPRGPGSGICCGYTMTRAILGDAVALVRGDRFYTTDYTPSNLTVWGFQDCARDPNNGAYGAALPKLLMRHLPRHYPGNNIYSLFPFFTPEQTLLNLQEQKTTKLYSLERPKAVPRPKVVDSLAGVRAILGDPKKFEVMVATIPKKGERNIIAEEAIKWDSKDRVQVAQANDLPLVFKSVATDLIKRYSYSMDGAVGTRIDIVQCVANLIGVNWVANNLLGIPLKTKTQPNGLYTEQEVFDMLSTLHARAFVDVEPELSWVLENTAQQYFDIFVQLAEQALEEADPKPFLNPLVFLKGIVANFAWPSQARKPYHEVLSALSKRGLSSKEIAQRVLALAVSSAVPYAQSVAQIVDFYLDDARQTERAEVVRLANRPVNSEEDRKRLVGYVKEAQRLNPQAAGFLRRATVDTTLPGSDGKSISVSKGDVVFASVKNAYLNPKDFPSPTSIDLNRPTLSYSIPGYDLFLEDTIPDVIKAIFRLKNLCRAEGIAGKLTWVEVDEFGTKAKMFLDDTGCFSRRAGSLVLLYDAGL